MTHAFMPPFNPDGAAFRETHWNNIKDETANIRNGIMIAAGCDPYWSDIELDYLPTEGTSEADLYHIRLEVHRDYSAYPSGARALITAARRRWDAPTEVLYSVTGYPNTLIKDPGLLAMVATIFGPRIDSQDWHAVGLRV